MRTPALSLSLCLAACVVDDDDDALVDLEPTTACLPPTATPPAPDLTAIEPVGEAILLEGLHASSGCDWVSLRYRVDVRDDQVLSASAIVSPADAGELAVWRRPCSGSLCGAWTLSRHVEMDFFDGDLYGGARYASSTALDDDQLQVGVRFTPPVGEPVQGADVTLHAAWYP